MSNGVNFKDLCIDLRRQLDRVTAERDAALAENKLLRHDVASYLETVAKVCDMLGVHLESAKSAEGKPSDVLLGYVSSMQQRLTAADEREDALGSLVSEAELALKALNVAVSVFDVELADSARRGLRLIIAALKPAEGGGDEYRKSCEIAHKALSMENQRIVAPGQFKCLACGDIHQGSGNLPCPKMSPIA